MEKLSIRKTLAELTVIVLGVLIALFAESAWNDYQGRVEGRNYFSRLSVEMKTNVELLDQDTTWTELSCMSIESALAHVRGNNGERNSASALRHLAYAAMFTNAEYQRVTYDDLVETGNLALIGDAALRADIVSAYTNFFEGLDSWRPTKESALRTAALRALPREYVERVVSECVTGEEDEVTVWKDCSTTPAARSADYWLDQLVSQSGLEGFLAERAWQVCQFEGDMADRRDQFNSLSLKLDSLSK